MSILFSSFSHLASRGSSIAYRWTTGRTHLLPLPVTSNICTAMDSRKKPSFMLLFLCLCLVLNPPLSLGVDTISGNVVLSGDQTIISAGEAFELGFFSPGNSSKYYIGIWYGLKKVSTQTIVWVANRDKPVSDKHSSELRISNGNLVLFDESKLPVWSTNVSSASTTSSPGEAVLLDTGNLVLRDGSDNSSNPFWQSFDHTADTWLPGGKMVLNKRTRQSQLLTSWRNTQDPAPGLFSLELDPEGTSQYLILWNRTEQYWTSGPWDNQSQIFSKVPEMRLNYIYDFSYVDNENESYFTYSVKDNSISRFVMDVSGQIKQLSWLPSKEWNLFWSQPRQQCEVYAFCGPFGSCNEQGLPFCTCIHGFEPKSQRDWDLKDYSGGCARKTKLQCENINVSNGNRDGFLMSPHMKLPEHSQSVKSGSAEDCESICTNNCSCTAYAYDSNGCSIWHGELLNLQQLGEDDSSGKTLNIKLSDSELPKPKDNKNTIIGAVVGSVAGILFLCLLLFVILRQRRKGSTKAADGTLLAFSYRDLQSATKNFSEKLGGGGFGSVFKGILPDSTVIGVKKLQSISQGEKQFRTEVSTIGTIQHVNLVRLRGFCSEGKKKLLVYDYMGNGSLDSHLFTEESRILLDWKTRYQIALGTARGLTYLHEKCRDCIIHCDIKPENILLDAVFCPKVADFGLAKLVGREFSRVLTTMRGTRGYLAPEWISGVAITAKADVYSYGMMLFEIVSGRRNTQQSEDGKIMFFPTHAASIIAEGGRDVFNLLDPKLNGNADAGELTKICRVACWCIQDDEAHRPSMGQVVQILEGLLDVNLPHIPMSIQAFANSQEDQIVFFTQSSTSQSSQARSNASTNSQAKSSASSASYASSNNM